LQRCRSVPDPRTRRGPGGSLCGHRQSQNRAFLKDPRGGRHRPHQRAGNTYDRLGVSSRTAAVIRAFHNRPS